MSVLIDANLLVYATMSSMPEHRAARSWLEGVFNDADGIAGLAWTTLYALVRLISSRRVMGDAAVGLAPAWAAAEVFRSQPSATMIEPGPGHAAHASRLIATPGLSANDVPDVYLAALAMENGLAVATHDHGFARFADLRWIDPLDGRR